MRTERVARILGGRKFLRKDILSITDLRDLIHLGLPASSLVQMLKAFSMPQEEAAKALGISIRTITRRLSGQARLSPIESEKAIRLARGFARAEEVFEGNPEKVVEWFRRSNRGLGGESPLSLMDSDLGAMQVDDILGRIQEGVIG